MWRDVILLAQAGKIEGEREERREKLPNIAQERRQGRIGLASARLRADVIVTWYLRFRCPIGSAAASFHPAPRRGKANSSARASPAAPLPLPRFRRSCRVGRARVIRLARLSSLPLPGGTSAVVFRAKSTGVPWFSFPTRHACPCTTWRGE